MKCKICYQKNFYLTRDMEKVYSDIEKIIWECPECKMQTTTVNFKYSGPL